MPGPGGGVPGPRGGCLLLGGCLVPGGVWSWGVSGPGRVPGGDTPGMATAAGSTHPTEIHSCLNIGSF